jgi:predicted phage terminase large subunit-like protein
VEDLVYNNGLPDITRPLVADLFLRNKVVRADVELNNGGNYYAEELQNLISQKNGKTSIRIFYSGNNKQTKIVTYSDFVKKNFLFKHESTYSSNSEYALFMKALRSWTQRGKNLFDDAPDSVAMLAQLFQDLSGMSVKILNRRELKI